MNHFYDILKEHKIDILKEYNRLVSFFYNGFPVRGQDSIEYIVGQHFMQVSISIRGSNTTFNEFLECFEINFHYAGGISFTIKEKFGILHRN